MKRCIDCNSECTSVRCRSCYMISKGYNPTEMGSRTRKDIEYRASKQQGANNYSRIRDHAAKVVKKLGIDFSSCSVCGYDKHVHICHIKPISSFDETSTLSEINSPDNLIILCPNCHWEFDHNLLKIGGK